MKTQETSNYQNGMHALGTIDGLLEFPRRYLLFLTHFQRSKKGDFLMDIQYSKPNSGDGNNNITVVV